MSDPTHTLEVAEADFDREVVERSAAIPVVVDFWAPWCGPCKALGPLLERLALEYGGEFLLAKVDVDQSPAVASRYAVRSIPLVLGFRNGQVVAEFTGAQPEGAIREFLARLLPTQADRHVEEGNAAAAEGRADAADHYRAALELEPRHEGALLGLSHQLGAQGDAAEALALLDRIPPGGPLRADADRLGAELRTQLEGGDEDEDQLRARVEATPGDLGARLALGRAQAARRSHAEALETFLAIVQADAQFEDEAARKAMLDLFEVLGAQDPLTQQYRQALARALFR